MIVGFTGTRYGMTIGQKTALKTWLAKWRTEHPTEELWFHHGDCIGADAEAHAIFHEDGARIIIHPPINPRLRAFCGNQTRTVAHLVLEPLEYKERNRNIVKQCQLLIAAPQYDAPGRSGSWSTISFARYLQRNHLILNPNGSTTEQL